MHQTETEADSDALPTPHEYADKVLRARLERMLSHREAVARGEETEPLKQMRVWSRRTRAALDLFRACYPVREFAVLEGEIKSITGALGAARDLDVMIASLHQRTESLPLSQRAGLEAYLDSLTKERKEKQKAVEKIAAHLEQADLLARFDALADLPVPKRKKSGHRKGQAAFEVDPQESLFVGAAEPILARLEAMLAYEDCLDDPDRVFELHEMRIAAKRLRYTMEIFQEVYTAYTDSGKEFAATLEEVKGLQDHLGEIHDADVLVPLLTAQAMKLLTPKGRRGKRAEIVGAHHLDYDACLGLLTLCAESRHQREDRFALLLSDWARLKAERTFETFRSLCLDLKLNARKRTARRESLPAVEESVIPTEVRPASASTETTNAENAALENGDADAKAQSSETGNVRPAVRRTRRVGAARPRRAAADNGRHTESGPDTGARPAKGRTDEPDKPESGQP